MFGKSPIGAFLRFNGWLWDRIPPSATDSQLLRSYGLWVNTLVRRESSREMSLGTFFLRNRPELRLIARLAGARNGQALNVAVLGASNGAEVYSIVWAIRAFEPLARPAVHAVDISPEALESARAGTYSLTGSEVVGEPIFERLSELEMVDLFDRQHDRFRVKDWISQGISWHLADACDPLLRDLLGPQDIVVANRFLCHMAPANAEKCLRSIARLVAPGGYLFVSGVDLDVRTRVANELGWKPVRELMQEMHEGDPSLRSAWPCKYWGLEPFDRNRLDWQMRYASAFQLGSQMEASAAVNGAVR